MTKLAKKDKKDGIYAVSIDFDFPRQVKEYGYLKTIWGYDIFLNGVPFLKTLVLLNIVASVLVWVLTRHKEDENA